MLLITVLDSRSQKGLQGALDHVSGTSLYDEPAALTENHCDGVSGETVTVTCSID